MEQVDVTVRFTANTYAAVHGGKRATCTAGPAQAAKRLSEKLWGDGSHCAQELQVPFGMNTFAFRLTRAVPRCPRTLELPL